MRFSGCRFCAASSPTTHYVCIVLICASVTVPAGETMFCTFSKVPRRVYPRAYGGTTQQTSTGLQRGGLSPRVRGNPTSKRLASCGARSIPARTGEPPTSAGRAHCRWVYPRAYGGTSANRGANFSLLGLSPRVRGNHLGPKSVCNRIGSIPARTGEPLSTVFHICRTKVYPRAYGGTMTPTTTEAFSIGLSPRVRGNRLQPHVELQVDRSIPARTGEPERLDARSLTGQVYPRAYGGTEKLATGFFSGEGLSPRVRGNRIRDGITAVKERSIPARTGEPFSPIPHSHL